MLVLDSGFPRDLKTYVAIDTSMDKFRTVDNPLRLILPTYIKHAPELTVLWFTSSFDQIHSASVGNISNHATVDLILWPT